MIEFSRSNFIISIYKFSDCFFISDCILSIRPWSWVDIGVIKSTFGANFGVKLIVFKKSSLLRNEPFSAIIVYIRILSISIVHFGVLEMKIF